MIRYKFRVLAQGLALSALVLGAGCTKEPLEPTVDRSVDFAKINTVPLLRTVMDGAYEKMSTSDYYGRNVIILGEVRSDNCVANGSSNRYTAVSAGTITTSNGDATDAWTEIYATNLQANGVIALENKDLEGDQAMKKAIVGEAYAMRALAHYDLFRLFGAMHVNGAKAGIPYVTEYPPKNLTPSRNTADEIKAQLYQDLDKAISMMPAPKIDGGKKFKQRLNLYAAYVIKARVALYFSDWATAKTCAEAVEASNAFRIISKGEYVQSWRLKLNPNSIFELAYSESDNPSINGLANIYQGDGYGDISATKEIKAAFEPGDVRGGDDMIGEHEDLKAEKPDLPFFLANLGKYVDWRRNTDNIPLMRFEEVKLIKAEALFRLGDNAGALAALNEITAARGASAYAAVDEDAILLERRRELCFEGFRFDDLARFKRDIPACDVGGWTKSAPQYGDKLFALPIPNKEISANANIGQNPGY